MTGDQVMAALQLRPGADFDPAAFATFLSAQPDMGTKWAPRFLRVADALPTTATSKVLTRTLRAQRWRCSDPVWWSPDGPGVGYTMLEQADMTVLDEAVAGRSGVATS